MAFNMPKGNFGLMRRNTRLLRSAGAVPPSRPQAGEITRNGHSRSEQKILRLDRRKSNLEQSREKLVSSSLMVQDRELARILHELDRISEALKSEPQNAQTLSDALLRTVQCAVEQSLLDRQLCSLALTDDLTRLYNRRAFVALAEQQLKLARRSGQSLLLFFADVDNLKEINDFYGHQEGDLALIRAASALEQTFRNSDVIARFGGDEFAVLAPEASCEDQEVILHRLERTLKQSHANESPYEMTLSVGMSRFDPKRPVELGKLIAIADQAMYAEKKTRSKLCVT
jgi:diguanylate cyclase (GGDEF)-like protein